MKRMSAACLVLLLASAPPPAGAEPQPEATPATLLVWESTLYGRDESALSWPVAVAAADGSEIVVADLRPPRLVVFRERPGEWVPERVIPLPAAPVGVAGAGDRYLVSLRGPSGLLAVDRSSWGPRPLPLPPGAVAGAVASVPGGGFVMLDPASGDAILLSPSGSVTRRVALAGRPLGVAPAPGGGLYAAYAETARVVHHGPDGRAEQVFAIPSEGPVPAWPCALAADPGGRLMVLDRHAARILVLDASGAVKGSGSRRGRDQGLLEFPAALAALPDGRLAVADQGNGRVQVFHRADPEARR